MTPSLLRRALPRLLVAGWLLLGAAAEAPAQPASRHLAPGFTQLPKAAKVVLVPIDVELFSLSAGGIAEPRADWTATAHKLLKDALHAKKAKLGLQTSDLDEAAADELAEPLSLHAAVAQSIALHHGLGGNWALPTKEGRLDWSFGETMQPLADRSGADYGLFVWVRDSYASAERKAAMVLFALVGVGLAGGTQVGYASLVDLKTGQVVWFNRLLRGAGDLREEKPAAESVDALLGGFPPIR